MSISRRGVRLLNSKLQNKIRLNYFWVRKKLSHSMLLPKYEINLFKSKLRP